MTSHLTQFIQTTITNILSPQLLKEILNELHKYDTWKSNVTRGLMKCKQSRQMNRDQLISFMHAEWSRLTEAAVHLQYVFLPKLAQHDTMQTPFVEADGSDRRLQNEFHKLNDWVIKRDELYKRYQEYMEQIKSKIPVHKQDHEPVRRCPNPRCNNIALFKYTPDTLVCTNCAMSQKVLDNNIAYGEEVEWTDSKSRNRSVKPVETAQVTLKTLLHTPYLMKTVPKKFDLSTMFHYNVCHPMSLHVARDLLTKDMLQFLSSAPCAALCKQWHVKPSSDLLSKAQALWKRHLKDTQFTHTPSFLFAGACAMLQWSPPPIDTASSIEISKTLYLFDVALQEYQEQHPDSPIANIRRANFRKHVLRNILDMKQIAQHLHVFLPLSKHDKLNRLYDSAFQTVCHYMDSVRS